MAFPFNFLILNSHCVGTKEFLENFQEMVSEYHPVLVMIMIQDALMSNLDQFSNIWVTLGFSLWMLEGILVASSFCPIKAYSMCMVMFLVSRISMHILLSGCRPKIGYHRFLCES